MAISHSHFLSVFVSSFIRCVCVAYYFSSQIINPIQCSHLSVMFSIVISTQYNFGCFVWLFLWMCWDFSAACSNSERKIFEKQKKTWKQNHEDIWSGRKSFSSLVSMKLWLICVKCIDGMMRRIFQCIHKSFLVHLSAKLSTRCIRYVIFDKFISFLFNYITKQLSR